MIFVDSRIGSEDLCAPLQRRGLDAELVQLPFADVAFESKDGKQIGVELKKVPDLVSSLRSGRLTGHQLPGLLENYQYVWIVVEGYWRVNKVGQVVLFHGRSQGWKPVPGRMLGSELTKHLLTLELRGNVRVHHTTDRGGTLHWLQCLYRWWTDKSFEEHRSHLTAHQRSSFLPVSDFRACVEKFPGIGPKASLAVETTFGGSLQKAVMAGVDEWAAITTLDRQGKPRRLGIKVAEKVVQFCRGGQ